MKSRPISPGWLWSALLVDCPQRSSMCVGTCLHWHWAARLGSLLLPFTKKHTEWMEHAWNTRQATKQTKPLRTHSLLVRLVFVSSALSRLLVGTSLGYAQFLIPVAFSDCLCFAACQYRLPLNLLPVCMDTPVLASEGCIFV